MAEGNEFNPMQYDEWAKDFVASTKVRDFPTIRYWQGQFWRWSRENPRYEAMPEAMMIDSILQWLRKKGISSLFRTAEAVMHCVRADTRVPPEVSMPAWLGPASTKRHSWYIALANTLVDPLAIALGRTGGSYNHTPTWFSNILLPYNYDPKARAPRWEAWLKEMFKEDDEVRILRQAFGYWITPDTSRQAAFFLYGPEGTGKSTVAYVAQHLVGKDYTSAVGLSTLGEKFVLASTLGKLLNISDEVGQFALKAESTFKWFLGGNEMTFERKYEQPFSGQPTARLLVSVNHWPKIADPTGAVYRRIYVIPMFQRIAREKMDRELWDKLVLEMPGIFNWALGGLADLLAEGTFVPCQSGLRVIRAQMRANQPITTFIEDMLKEVPDAFVSRQALKDAFIAHARREGTNEKIPPQTLLRSVRAYFPNAVDYRKRVGNAQVWGLQGIQLQRSDLSC